MEALSEAEAGRKIKMDELLWSVDDRKYEENNGQTLRLDGWAADRRGEAFALALYGNGETRLSIPAPERYARPDVAAGYPEVPGMEKPGFTVKIPGIWKLAEEYDALELCLVKGENRTTVWRAEAGELWAFCREQLLSVHMDREEVIYKTMLMAEGWVLMQKGTEKILAEDEKGAAVPVKLTRGRRPDVTEQLGLGEDWKNREIGFQVSARLADIPGRKLVLRFVGNTGEEEIRQTHVIDIKKLQAENSPMGRRKRVLAWENRRENLAYLKSRGLKEFLKYVDLKAGIVTGDYEEWLSRHSVSRMECHKQRKTVFPKSPLISIVIPLYNTPLPYLKEVLDSICRQTYSHWQLCLADGSQGDELARFIEQKYGKEKRIVYQRLKKNEGISENTNRAIELATGEFIMLCDHDDVVAPDALFEIVKAVNIHPAADVLYTDEDKISMDGKHYFEPNFKPDYNLFRLRENNYICHIFVVKRTLLEQAGLFRREFDGAQDFDLILRCCELANKIVHIPRVLYHWRCHMESTAADPASKAYAFEAGRVAVEEHYQRLGIKGRAELTKNPGWYRSRVEIKGNPKISIIIPNKDHIRDLKLCLSSIREKTTYDNVEILVVENNSQEPETFAFYKTIPEEYPGARVLTWKSGFNFSAINNFAVKEASGEYVLFLNNDVEILTPGWLEEMLMICQQQGVGAVGAKLYYPDDTIQHAGVVIGLGGVAGHIMCRAAGNQAGYMGRLITVQEMSAVTAACMLVKRQAFEEVSGFDEEFVVAFNDIDLCMKLWKKNWKVVFTPYAELYHYESKSRGMEDTPEKQLRFQKETKRFEKKWARELAEGDPCYSPNLSVTEGDCSLREV